MAYLPSYSFFNEESDFFTATMLWFAAGYARIDGSLMTNNMNVSLPPIQHPFHRSGASPTCSSMEALAHLIALQQAPAILVTVPGIPVDEKASLSQGDGRLFLGLQARCDAFKSQSLSNKISHFISLSDTAGIAYKPIHRS